MCCSLNREAMRAATHYHTRAWQTLIYGKECYSRFRLQHIIDKLGDKRQSKTQFLAICDPRSPFVQSVFRLPPRLSHVIKESIFGNINNFVIPL